MESRPKRLGEILIAKGIISEGELKEALLEQKNTKEFLGELLIKKGKITEVQLIEALSEQFGIPRGKIEEDKLDWGLVDKLARSLVIEHRCFPLELKEDRLILAVDNPLDAWVVSQAKDSFPHYPIERVLITKSEMDKLLTLYRQHRKERIKKLFEL